MSSFQHDSFYCMFQSSPQYNMFPQLSSIREDDLGNAHLQDKSGSDLSTRSFGDKIVAESKLDIYSGRMLQVSQATI